MYSSVEWRQRFKERSFHENHSSGCTNSATNTVPNRRTDNCISRVVLTCNSALPVQLNTLMLQCYSGHIVTPDSVLFSAPVKHCYLLIEGNALIGLLGWRKRRGGRHNVYLAPLRHWDKHRPYKGTQGLI